MIVFKLGWLNWLSLHFNGHFPGEPGLAGVYWSKGWQRWWWWQLNYWSYKSCKAPVKSSPPTNQQPVFFTGQMPFLSPNQHCQSTEGEKYHIPWTCLPQTQLCLWPLVAPGYLEEGCCASHQPFDASTPLAWLAQKVKSGWAACSANSFIFVFVFFVVIIFFQLYHPSYPGERP